MVQNFIFDLNFSPFISFYCEIKKFKLFFHTIEHHVNVKKNFLTPREHQFKFIKTNYQSQF